MGTGKSKFKVWIVEIKKWGEENLVFRVVFL